MKMKLSYLIAVCFLLLAAGNLSAQKLERQVQSTTGAGVKFPDFEVDYTVGEAIIVPLKITGTLLTQGFQQPPNGLRVIGGLNDDLILYPNPVSESASIKFTLDTLTMHVDVRVVNIMGQVVFTDKIMAPEKVPYNTPTNERPIVWALTYTYNAQKLMAGIYILQIKTNTGFAVAKKFVKMNN
jgi:hypothetical protein